MLCLHSLSVRKSFCRHVSTTILTPQMEEFHPVSSFRLIPIKDSLTSTCVASFDQRFGGRRMTDECCSLRPSLPHSRYFLQPAVLRLDGRMMDGIHSVWPPTLHSPRAYFLCFIIPPLVLRPRHVYPIQLRHSIKRGLALLGSVEGGCSNRAYCLWFAENSDRDAKCWHLGNKRPNQVSTCSTAIGITSIGMVLFSRGQLVIQRLLFVMISQSVDLVLVHVPDPLLF